MLANPGYQLNGIPVIKIGYTTHSMAASLRQIYSTGVPFPFEVKYHAMVWKARATMRLAHRILHAQRLNNERDFFNCTIQEAIAAVELSVQGDITYKAERPPELYSADTAFNPDALKEPDIVEEEAAQKAWSENKRTDTPGYVYVLTNEVYHDGHAPLLKIGYTRKEPKERAEDLYYWEYECWGVPQNFNVAFAARFEHAFDAEQRVHEFLKEFRVNHWREFFSCTLEEAKLAILAEQDREVSQNVPAKITFDPNIVLAEKQEPTSRPVPVPVPAPIIVSPQRPERPPLVLQPATSRHELRSRWHLSQRQVIAGLILAGCVAVAVPGYHFLSNWVSSLQTPTATQAPDPAPHPKTKKAHGHPKKKKKKHKIVKNQQPSEGTAEPAPQYETPPPADIAPSNQAGDPNPG